MQSVPQSFRQIEVLRHLLIPKVILMLIYLNYSSNYIFFFLNIFSFRFIVMRRVFLIMAVLYFMRSITMYVTVLPVSSTTYYCSPKANSTTPLVIAKRVFQLISGFGLSINGKHTYCGDSIYSGHTVMLVLGYLVIAECKYLLAVDAFVELNASKGAFSIDR